MKTIKVLLGTIIVMGFILSLQYCTPASAEEDDNLVPSVIMNPSSNDENCPCSVSTSFMIPTEICVVGDSLDSIKPTSAYFPTTSGEDTLANIQPLNYCSGDESKTVPVSLTSPSVVQSQDTITCSVSIPTEKGSTNQPAIFIYDKKSNDTLFVIISYSEGVNYESSTIQFEYSKVLKYTFIKTNLLLDDPKTSRGTVTTVQGHRGPIYNNGK